MRILVGLAIVALGCLWDPAFAQERESNYKHLKPIQSLIGQWKMAGKWEDGKEFVGEEYSAWMLDKNFMRSTGWFQNYEGQRVDYYIVTGWDPRKKQIVETFSTSDGGHSKRVGKFHAKTRIWKCKENGVDGDGKQFSFDVDIHFVADDKIVWKGTNFKGQQPLPPLTFTFTRVKPPAESDRIPEKALAALEFFVGSWEGETSVNGKSIGKSVGDRKWLPGRHAIQMETAGTEDGRQRHGSGITGWDAEEEQLVEHWYTSDGLSATVRYPLDGMKDDAWAGNFSVTYGDGREFAGDCVLKKTASGFEWTAKWVEDGEAMVRKGIAHRVK